MQAPRVDIISIGCLSRNRLWNETTADRTPHATTTLVRAGKRVILVDPGLPGTILAARLHERTGLKPEAIDTLFVTNFRPAHRGGLVLFEHAQWIISEVEQDAARASLQALIDDAPEEDDDRSAMERELQLLGRFRPAPDKLADGVDLFPLFGYTPGTCGLLISTPTVSTLIAGDAVPTLDHFLAGQVLPDSQDIAAAQESLREAYEIADLIVPGHDNLFLNPRMMGM
ncbi:MAG TPA: MBL fold metallo-hydrolase [Tepidisphaeraceae bacterium]|nr:MBL fold metallo-hydrolase [Tepidisphaeraceae bacterium]